MKLTKAGVLYILLTLFIGFAAVNTGNNLLFLIVSALLGFMAVSGVFGWLNIRGVELSLELPEEIYDGLDTMAVIRLENRKSMMPSFLLRVKTLGGEVGFTAAGRNGKEAGSLLIRMHGRGLKPVGEVLIETGFPINFFVRSKKYDLTGKFTVFPAPLPCTLAAGLADRGKQGETIFPLRGADGEVARIVDYTGREPLKFIHWRISARHEELKVKELTATTVEPLIIDLDSLPGVDLERVVSCGAYLVNRYIRQNRPVGLKAAGLIIKPDLSKTHRLRLLGELAVYGKN